jgi:RNA polymerase sigma factor FliA
MAQFARASETPDVQDLIPRVRRVAYRMKRRLPSHIDVDDLIGAGLLGLAQAQAHWQSGEPGAFAAFAMQRAMGAMLDELRRTDQLTRAQRRLAARLVHAEQTLSHSLGRQPELQEIANAVGMSSGEVQTARTYTTRLNRVSLSATEGIAALETSATGPEGALEEAQRTHKVRLALGRLPGRLRTVVDLSCTEQLTLREIGRRLGVTEARVCQLRKEAVSQLRRSCADTILPPADDDWGSTQAVRGTWGRGLGDRATSFPSSARAD